MSDELQRQFATEVVQTLVDHGYEAYWAGGCVRDALLGFTPKDYDVATSARPDQVRAVFGKHRTLSVGESFGVIMLLDPKRKQEPLEVATFRTDGQYSDGRRPDSVEFCTAEQDALRRDYTINGMFYDPLTERVLDYVGGQEDLKSGIIRAIGNPYERMEEDKLRMLRAVRFTARFGFQLDTETATAIQSMSKELSVVSQERIAQELRAMLKHPRRELAIRLTRSLELLTLILPEIEYEKSSWTETLALLDLQSHASFELAMMILLRHTDQKSRLARLKSLKLSNSEVDAIDWLVEHQHALKHADQMPLHRLKPFLIHPHIELLLEWTRFSAVHQEEQPVDEQFCRNYKTNTPAEVLDPVPLLTGNDLMTLGYKPGPQFSKWLSCVRDAQLDELISSTEEAVSFLKNRIDSESNEESSEQL